MFCISSNIRALSSKNFFNTEKYESDNTLWTLSDYVDELENKNSKVFLLTKDTDSLEAFIFYRLNLSQVEIIQLAVKYKNNGVGSYLLDSFISAQRNSIMSVLLECSDTNTAAISFYRNAGFRQVGLRKNYYRNKDNALLFERLIG